MEQLISKEDKNKLIDDYLGFYLDNIKDEVLKAQTIRALKKAPEYFWTRQPNVSVAPEDELEKHAMPRRIAKTAYYCKSFVEAIEFQDYKDEMICASLLHDIQKYEGDAKCHGPRTSEWLRKLWMELSTKQEFVVNVVRLHDGRKWSGLKDLPLLEMRLKPFQVGAYILYLSVVTASRTKTVFEWS
jgi:hypothetical protein